MAAAAVVFTVLVLAFAASARALSRLYLTAPIAFVAAGALMSVVAGAPSLATVLLVTMVAKVALVLILFYDAAQVRPRAIRRDAALVARFLLVALPVSVLLGFLAAQLVFADAPAVTALLLAAALAPTDAGLGAATVANPVVPVRVRRLLNVESGLSDGLVTPVVLFAIAGLSGGSGSMPVGDALVDVAVGVLVGIVVGVGGGLLLGWSSGHEWSTRHSRALGVLGLPVLAYCLGETLHVNGFVAVFVAGTAFAGAAAWADREPGAIGLTETLSEPLGYAVWLVFGLAATPVLWANVGWREALYAVASLTVVRLVPVALALIGTGFRWRTVAFVGWFGPRGLPTLVFALIALQNLELKDSGRSILAAATLTVLLSVVGHGVTADALAARYGAWIDRVRPAAETADAIEPRARRSLLTRRHAPA